MIQHIVFTNRFGRSIRCKLGAPEQTGMAILNADGLGPGSASVNIHNIATADGGYFGSARYSYRNIVVRFRLLEWDGEGRYVPIEDTRHLAYEFFAPKTKLRIVVVTDKRSLVIEGYVESCEPTIFSQTEGVSVSILCPSYYFKMISETGDQQADTIYGEGLFHFPFSNESLTKKLIQFGDIQTLQKHLLYYDGDSETGFSIEVVFSGEPVTSFSILNEPIGNSELGPVGFDQASDTTLPGYQWHDDDISSNYIGITLSRIAAKLSGRYAGYIYAPGSRIVITSMVGQKSAVYYDPSNNAYNILDAIDHLDWLKLFPGYNEFRIQTDQASVMHFTINVNYSALYIGV